MTYTAQDFTNDARDFKSVTAAVAEKLIASQTGEVVFVGRPTCHFCRKFMPKLHQVAKDHQIEVNYLSSEVSGNTEEIEAFRNHYKVQTVPALVYSDQEGTKIVCDSSLEPEEIEAFLNLPIK
ncbi:glutaredoxin family protein [Hutsoniella sourekii]|uniref:glutaredoxin family protein n=1 Tax=Hutsoniella sourekii TaxID=87650 RepID=UPI0004845C46|nr:glutaredoxin family protein [Hutsoniella sourekii]